MSNLISYKIFECAVDPARIPGRAPTVLVVGAVHAGSEGLAINLSEEGYQVVLVDNSTDSSSLSSLRKSRTIVSSDEYISDPDLRDTVGWSVAVNLVNLIDNHVTGGWNRYTAFIALRLDQQDADLVRALHIQTSKRGGLSAYIGYGSQLSIQQTLQAFERIGDYPILLHLPESNTELINALVDAAKRGDLAQDALPFHPELDQFRASLGPLKINDTDRSAAAMSYSRTLSLLKSTMGPRFPVEQLWDQHTYFEFASRDSAKTMSTMVSDPYVNHVACLTGGADFVQLARFYEHHFTTVSPPDTALIPISHTIATDSIIDEMVFSCTHTTMIDYFLPGVPPTRRKLRIPIVGIVNLRGHKLAYESLY
uniref:Uncharacterized protein n=1 Tax=Melanopsichium pennsylvanicum 4 TaxID=1398559 RepID=A0A077QRJ1_9BASI|nr:conserved hypothetical protein [Melanopsichium pennsylvanicum 4]